MKISEEEMQAAMEVAAYKLGVEFYSDWEGTSRKGTVATRSNHRRYVVVGVEHFVDGCPFVAMRLARDWSSVERAIIEEVEAGVKAAGHRWLQPCWEAMTLQDSDFHRTAVVEEIGDVQVQMLYSVRQLQLRATRKSLDIRTGSRVDLREIREGRAV